MDEEKDDEEDEEEEVEESKLRYNVRQMNTM